MAAFPIFRPQVLVATTLLMLGGTVAAPAQDRCEGTLCDLYYDHMAKPSQRQPAQGQPAQGQPAPQAPRGTAQTVPAPPGDGLLSHLFSGGTTAAPQADGAPPAKKPLVAVQGGGVVGLMQGRAPERCTGTFCDLYYGGPPKEVPEAAGPAAAVPASAGGGAEAEVDAPVATTRGREPRESVRSCEVNARDPWACYR